MSAPGDWTTKIKALRALVSRGPDSSPSSTTTLSSTATTSPLSEIKQKQNAGATKEKTTTAVAAAAASSPSQPIRRLSHKQIDDLVRDTLEQSGLDTGDSHNARIASAVASAVARAALWGIRGSGVGKKRVRVVAVRVLRRWRLRQRPR